MKKILRILGWSLGGLLLLIAIAGTAIYALSARKLHRHFEVTVSPAPIPTDAGAVERGRHIATTRGCLHCHGEDLAGDKVVDDPLIGKVYGANLTCGVGGLPANFTNEDWVRAIRHGLHSDGRPLFIMPAAEFAHLSEADFGALLAFLTSAPKVDRPTIPVQLGPLGRVLLVADQIKLAADLIDHAHVHANNVAPGVTVEYGRYLSANCTGCHGPNFRGGKIAGAPPEWPPAANLTPYPGGPLMGWTEANFIAALRTGRTPDGTELNAAMPRTFGVLTDGELKALWMYLQTLPPLPPGKHTAQQEPAPERGHSLAQQSPPTHIGRAETEGEARSGALQTHGQAMETSCIPTTRA